MNNIEIIRDKVKFHIQDTSIVDDEIDKLILLAIEDIATQSNLFKKMYGFSVHKEVNVYDFEALANLSETLEEELSEVSISPPTDEQIKNFFDNVDILPEPNVDKSLFYEVDGKSKFISVLDIFDSNAVSATSYFKYRGTHSYIVTDNEFLKENDTKQFIFVASVIPSIDELLPDSIATITSAVINGVKYYTNDTFSSQQDGQLGNLYYQRFFAKIKELINRYPTLIASSRNTSQKNKWV